METKTPVRLKLSVSNMRSTNGNVVPNQFTIRTDNGLYFQSYKAIIAFRNNDGKVFLDDFCWDYSKTTGIYRNIFLNENIAETRKKIESGEYILCDLN